MEAHQVDHPEIRCQQPGGLAPEVGGGEEGRHPLPCRPSGPLDRGGKCCSQNIYLLVLNKLVENSKTKPGY